MAAERTARRVPEVVAPAAPPEDVVGTVPEWQRFLLLVLLPGVALLLHAGAGSAARAAAPHGEAYFWSSLVLVLLPAAVVVLARGWSRGDRVFATLTLSTGLLFTRLLLYPTGFVYYDELLHQITQRLLLQDGQVFSQVNSGLPVSTYYPGLELATAAVHQVTGLSVHLSGFAVLMLGRVVQTLAMLLVFERLTRSTRVACLAVLVYAGNPQFLYYNSQFAYESLAIPLGLYALYLVADRIGGPARLLPVSATLLSLAVTHHLSSFLFCVGFVVWWALERRQGASERSRQLGLTALVSLVTAVGWLFVSGTLLVEYLYGIGRYSVVQTLDVLRGGRSRKFFTSDTGDVAPVWQRVVSLGSVALTTLLLLPAALKARRWALQSSLALLLVLAGLLYPIVPGGHLSAEAGEATDRAAGFLYVGLSLLLARYALGSGALSRLRQGVVLGSLVLLLVGGTVSGAGPAWLRLPGPYLVSADNRSVDAASLAAATWVGENLPHDRNVFADRIVGALLGGIGGQDLVISVGKGLDPSSVITDEQLSDFDRFALRDGRISYVIIDRRLSAALPKSGVYFQRGEVGADSRTQPVSLTALDKWRFLPGVQALYDNGAIVVYDVRGLSGVA